MEIKIYKGYKEFRKFWNSKLNFKSEWLTLSLQE